jgi:myosin heavy subunit
LREALSGQNKVDLDAKLNRLQLAQDEAAKQERAGEAMESLSKVSKAFEESEPKALQMAQRADSLKPDEQESFDLGLAELESLIKQREKNRQTSAQDQAKQGQEALFNLRTGLRSLYGNNERGNQILAQLEEMLKADAPVDAEILKKLMTELQHFSVESAEQLARKEDKPEVTNIDPTRLPPAYRGRIQKYFQKLSEK